MFVIDLNWIQFVSDLDPKDWMANSIDSVYDLVTYKNPSKQVMDLNFKVNNDVEINVQNRKRLNPLLQIF